MIDVTATLDHSLASLNGRGGNPAGPVPDAVPTVPDTSGARDDPHGRPVRILGIGGTTSAKSWSLVPLEAALAKARQHGCETTLATVYDLNLPLFHTEWRLEDYPPTLAWLLDEVRRADGLIICSPTYHGTISGAIKNVLDTLIFLGWDEPPYLAGKPVGLMAYGGMTAMGVLHALTNCVRGLKGISVPTHIAVPEDAIDRSRVALSSPKIEHRLDLMVDELVSFAGHLRGRVIRPGIVAQTTPTASTPQAQRSGKE
jgi:FMN reductase